MDEIKTEVVSDKYREEDNSDDFSDLQGTILWPRRSYLYRIAFLTLLPMFALFLLGFSSPFWMKKHQVDKYRGYYNQVDKVDVSIGLWRVCEGLDFSVITDCTSLPNTSSYEMACQSMLCLCLIFTFFSLTFGFYENFATRYDMDDGEDSRTRRPEVNAIVSGLFGMIGVSLYGALIIGVAKDGQGGVHWAFPVTASAVTGVTICGILMAISNPIHGGNRYPGHAMGVSRQNSTHTREMSMQDRLVSSNGLASPLSTNGAATYGLSTEDANATEMTVLQRSDSFISSHMSSPDLYTSTTGRSGDYNQRTHVVETYDLHARPSDSTRRQALKRQLESKAAQRRSWHSDDRNGAYNVSDLINTRPDGTSTMIRREHTETETIKPPVPPRRDKLSPSASVHSTAATTPQLQTISDETEDLMLLEDPVVTAPKTTAKKSLEKPSVPERKPSMKKKNTNPFLEDFPLQGGHQHAVDRNQSASNEGWDNQPWPDPPTESEILGEHLSYRRDQDRYKDQTSTENSMHTSSSSQSNAVPESLQYQPQNSGSLSRTAQTMNKGSNQGAKPDIIMSDQRLPGQEERKKRPGSMKDRRKDNANNDMNVPVMKEYDNPLFKRQAANNRQDKDGVAPPLYDSTSFIHPCPSPPQKHYALNPVDPLRRHSSHFPQRPSSDESFRQTQRQFYNGSPEQAVVQKQGSGKARAPDAPKRSSFREKPKISEKPSVKSRPRQIKREHNQRRTGQDSAGMPSPIPSPGFSISNPDLSRQSPKTSRHRNDSLGRGEGHIYDTPNAPFPHPPKTQPPAYSDVARAPPPYTSHASHASHSPFPHWGDSDL